MFPEAGVKRPLLAIVLSRECKNLNAAAYGFTHQAVGVEEAEAGGGGEKRREEKKGKPAGRGCGRRGRRSDL